MTITAERGESTLDKHVTMKAEAIEMNEDKRSNDAIPIDWLMRYALLPTEFAISEWRKADKEAMKKQARSLDKPMSFDEALRFVNETEST